MAETLVPGRKGQLFVVAESPYGTASFGATDAMRHLNFQPTRNPFNRASSAEKKQSPGTVVRFDRRETAGFSVEALLRPSGTLNTLPEASEILEAAFGSKTNVTLSTTFTPKAPTCALLPAEAGNVNNGAHSYKVGFRDAAGITKLSAASSPITTDAGHGKVTVTVPVGPTGTVSRDIYRTEADADPAVAANFKLVAAATINDNTTLTYVDNVADAGLSTVAHTTDTSTLLSTTVGFVADAGALAAGDAILITRNSVKYVRFLTAVSTTNLTWAPALPTAVVGDEVVKGCITYKLTTDLALSLGFAHYLTSDTTHSKLVKGGVVDSFGLAFGGNEEPRFTASGPAQTVATPAGAKPVAFTTVGAQNPPSGLVGELYVGSAAYKFKKLDLQIVNGMQLRMDEYGTSQASEILPRGRRQVTLGLDAAVGDESVIYDLAEAGTPVSILKQTGRTEGNIVAIYAPQVDFDVPTQDDGDDVPTWPFKGVCKESADAANDELRICLA